MGQDLTIYDKTQIFSGQNYLHMLKEACGFLNIPFVFQAAVKNTKEATEYVTESNVDNESMARRIDLSAEFNRMCSEILEKLRLYCSINLIPFYFCALVKNDSGGTNLVQEGNFCESNKITLTDDRITDHLRIANGFIAIPPESKAKTDNNYYSYDFYRKKDLSHIDDVIF